MSYLNSFKQDTLVSGTNIKTINGSSILGSGNLVISSATTWGSITGTLSSQTDLNTALSGKQNTITTGTTSQYLRGDLSLATFPTIPTVTPSALTEVDDTNVTITLGGTPATALLQPVSITAGWTGTLADSRIASASTWNAKQDAITNGYGLTGTTTKSISLTTAEAFCTAETTLNAATYADITGASITLAAGTWLILATINASSQSTTVTVINGAITDSTNAIIVEGAQHIVAGTATVRTWGNMSLSAIVTPGVSTTYKLRGARGTTTQTGNVIVSDGTGVNTTNNVSNNSDKSTSIRAIRIA